MDKNEKHELSRALRARIEAAPALLLVEFGGLTVDSSNELRAKFREAGCAYKVYKNSVIHYAIQGTKHEPLSPLLRGVSGLAFHVDDPGAPARVIRDFAKTSDKLRLKGGVIDGQLLAGKQAEVLADMPGPNELKAKLLSLLTQPGTNLVRVLAASTRDFLNVLNAKKDKDAA
jgi:large subunit ribosomal protein L10